MKKIIIVDDEKPARELLKMLINWEAAGYEIVSEARDGIEALEQYLQFSPDLIITDIQMPQMDGLSLIKEIKKLNKDQNIIVLSCHENFNYAREVMKLGIFDYLIKDSLTPEDLYTALKNSSYSEADEKNNIGVKSIINEKKSHALWNIINGKLNLSEYAEDFELCNICYNCQYFFIHIIIDTKINYNYSSEVLNKITGLLMPNGGIVCDQGGNHYVIFAIANSSHSQLDMLNQIYSIAQSIRTCIEQVTGCITTLGVSRISADVNQIREKNLEAQQALGYRVFLGKGKILYFDMIQNSARNIKVELINTRIENIKLALSQKNIDNISVELKSLYFSDLQGIIQYNYLQHVNALLLGLITTTCYEFNISYNTLFVDGTVPLDTIGNLETIDEMLSWFTQKFHSLIKTIESISKDQYCHRITKIVQYIQQHYYEDIGLESISNLNNIHKVYLAKIFKEDTGFSVNEFIRELRIQEAKKLLKNSDLNINEIVYKVGFQNSQSFYAIFKKFVGITPLEFRNM